MILDEGSKVLIIHRRLFDTDQSRFFIGVVDGYEAGIVRVTGYTWSKDGVAGSFLRKNELRTKIFSIASGTLIVYQLPSAAAVEKARLDLGSDGNVTLTDGATLKMDLSESVHHRLTSG